MKQVLTFLVAGSLLITGCKNGCSKKTNDQPTTDTSSVNLGELPDTSANAAIPDSAQIAINKDAALTHLTKEILGVFKSGQYSRLDSFIHPVEGVRFSPYATVSPDEDKHFSPEEFNKLVTIGKNKKTKWGNYDGSGEAIYLTPAEYFKKFVYDANFVLPNKFSINNFIGAGNSLNNLKKVYSNSDFTESYSTGSRKYGGTDWKTVRLVFKEIDGKYYLVGVVHDQWTI